MDETGELDVRDVPRSAENPFKIPYCFRCGRVNLIEKPSAVRLVEDPGETPGLVLEWLTSFPSVLYGILSYQTPSWFVWWYIAALGILPNAHFADNY